MREAKDEDEESEAAEDFDQCMSAINDEEDEMIGRYALKTFKNRRSTVVTGAEKRSLSFPESTSANRKMLCKFVIFIVISLLAGGAGGEEVLRSGTGERGSSSRAVVVEQSSNRAVIGEQWWRVVVEHSSGFGGIVTHDGDGIFERKEEMNL
ncbi:hypothetical protein Tco_0377633 [Tanacetum coccineum]